MTEQLPVLRTTTLAWPTDWTALFGVERPLILDIGFGYGHSLAYLQDTYPDHNIIGLEVDNISLTKAERRIVREGWANVRVVEGFAETALQHLFEPESLRQVHVNFPDPWFKRRHAGRRLMKRPTLDAITSRLQPGGMFYLATDIREYAEMSHELLAETAGLVNVLDSAWAAQRPHPFVTKYERRALAEGRPCYYFVYQRDDTPATIVPTIREEPTMPHLVFQSPLDLDAMMHNAELGEYQAGETVVRFLNRYRGDRAVLFEAFVHEPTLEQRVALGLLEKDGEARTYMLKLSSLGHPRPTSGVHFAARVLSEALIRLHPDAVVIHDKIQGGE